MKIVIASSEAVPFSKTGGLADVTSALAKSLSNRGHEVSLFIPHYPRIQAARNCLPLDRTDNRVEIQLGSKNATANLLWAQLPDSNARVFLVEQPDYFDREGLYGENGKDYPDNCERFVFFSRAVLEFVRRLVLCPDVVHANDWQTGLVPVLLDLEYRSQPAWERTASILTVHNMAFQGVFWHWDMQLTGIDWKYFNWKQMESYGHLNLLKSGIAFANKLNTVSPTYAQEIQTSEAGCGLEGILESRKDDLSGILNGIDDRIWNPETDNLIPSKYSAETVGRGKPQCKAALQSQVGLAVRDDVPLFGIVSRMTDQKGFDLIDEIAEELLSRELQLVILGTGEPAFEERFAALASHHPESIATIVGFDETLAHQIEAGCDFFLMPSRYEPCGLNQMYSLAYGTIPIVRRVGGLADSVVDSTETNISNGTATGFVFDEYDSGELLAQIDRALLCYAKSDLRMRLIDTGMRKDWTWNASALEYEKLYLEAQQAIQPR